MSIIGQTISAIIVEESELFYFLQKGEDLLRLDKTEGEHTVGDVVTGFVYVDKDDFGKGTYKRYKKDSFYWYKEMIESNGESLLEE